MVTAELVFALIGSLLLKAAISASINYEPIKITVNENFNTKPGQVSTELQALEPGVLHQGANFYFKPQLNLPQSFIPSHIEALISLIQQHHHSCAKDSSKVVVEKDKLIEILQPFMYPLSENSKERLLKNVLEKDNNLEIVKPPQIIEKTVTEPLPVIITEELKPVTPELLVIPEAPVLPQLTLDDVPAFIKKQVKKEESVILEEPKGEYLTIPEIAVKPIAEPLINYVEPKLMTAGLVNIPDAPVLPPFSLNVIPPNVEEIRKEETAIVEGQKRLFPAIPTLALTPIQESIINYVEPELTTSDLLVIPEAPVLPPITANDIKLIEDGVKIEELAVVDVESKPAIQEYVVIPEAPVLPPLALHNIPSIVEKEVKKEESIIFEDATGVFSTIPEIAVRPIQETIINYVEPELTTSDLLVIPEAPVLPTLSANDIHVLEEVKIEEPIVVDVEPNPVIQKLMIPEAPILPPLSLKSIPSFIEEKLKSVIFDERTSVVPTIPDMVGKPIEEPFTNYVEPKPIITEFQVIPEAPALPSFSANDIKIIEDGVKFNEPIVVDVEKPSIQEYVVIPEAPIYPTLALHDKPSIVEKEVKKEESIIFVDTEEVFSIIPEIAERPIQEPIINYAEPELTTSDLVVIPEAPVLPALSANDIHVLEEEVKIEEPIVVDVEPNPVIQELVIPEAPILPPLSLKSFPSFFEEKLKKEEYTIIEEPTGVLSTIPEIVVRPIEEPTINYVKQEPTTEDVLVIPEAPVLPTFSANNIHVLEEVKIEEPIVVDIEPNPVIQEFVIPEAPILPPVSVKSIPSFFEEKLKKEESIIFEEPTGVLSTIPEIVMRPIEEPTINCFKQEPTTADDFVIPEAPVLPTLSANDERGFLEEIKIEEPIDVDVEPAISTQELVIPDAPILPPLSFTPTAIEEDVKKEESIIFDAATDELPSIPEISSRPFPEPIVLSETAESFALQNNVFPVSKEEVKIEVPILLEETIDIFPPIAEISSGRTLESIQEPEITNSYVLEEYSEPNPERVVTVKETLQPTIIPKPSNNLGVFRYAPFVSHLFNRAPKTNQLPNAKPASLDRFLLKKRPYFKLPVTPFPKLSLNEMKVPIWGNKKQFLHPTSYAHYVGENGIAPSMAFKKNAPPKRVKSYIRSQVPKGPSYL